MFKNRSILLKMIKDTDLENTDLENTSAEDPRVAVEVAAAYAEILKDAVATIAVVTGSIWCVCKIVERICR